MDSLGTADWAKGSGSSILSPVLRGINSLRELGPPIPQAVRLNNLWELDPLIGVNTLVQMKLPAEGEGEGEGQASVCI